MAINFLNTVNLNKNQLTQAAIESQPNDAAVGGAPVEGQIYFNTTDFDLKIFANGAWKEVGATSGVETLSTTQAGNSTGNTLTVLTNAVGDVTINSFAYAGGSNIGYVPSGGTVDQYLDGAGNWIDITTGDIESVNASTVNNRLGIAITTPLGPDPVVGLDVVGLTNLGATAASDDELIIYDTSTTTNKSITVENLVGGYETTYDLTTAPTGTAIRLTSSDAGDPAEDVTISGTAGRTAISRISTTQLRVDLTDDVTIINDLTVSGVITQVQTGETNTFSSPLDMGGSTASVTPNKILNVATGTAATDGVNLGQVELLVAGVGVFQGGYNATTGLTVPGGGELDGTSNIALDKGDYFVVTTAGTAFFGLSLEPGDFIFAETAIAANSNPPVGDYIVVRADDNVAGAGATDGATQKGVSGFDSENFTVSSNGWVQLKPLANPYGAKVALTGGDNTTAGQTTFTVDVTALFGATADARNCKIEVLKDAGDLTVYPEVTRNGTGDVLLEFMPQVGNSLYSALITIV